MDGLQTTDEQHGTKGLRFFRSYLSQAKAGDFTSIPWAISGSASDSQFWLLVNIIAADFVRGSAITKHLNAPLS